MRFVWAVLAFVLAAASVGAAYAQRTVLLGPDEHTVTVAVTEDTPYLVIDAKTLATLPGTQKMTISRSGPIFEATARTGDIEGWLADQTWSRVVTADDGSLSTETITPTADVTDATIGRDPNGSDLWIEQKIVDQTLEYSGQLPDGYSLLIASGGSAPAPNDISITWPLEQRTPWFGPLMVLGGIFLLIGLVMLILGFRHTRRRRGPIRRGPEDLRGGRRRRSRARAMIAVPAIGVSVVLLAGCTADSWPQVGEPAPSPSPSETTVESGQEPPALTEEQAARIINSISATVANSEEKLDGNIAGQRLAGLALEARLTNYTIRTAVPEYAPLPTVPASPVRVVLPQATDGWPRTVLAVVENGDDATAAPTILTMVQNDPWSPYRATYVANLEASTTIPDVAPAWIGAPMVAPDSAFLTLAPNQIASFYADLLANGEGSAAAEIFDVPGDAFLTAVEQKRQSILDTFNETAAETGAISFGQEANPSVPVALATVQSGAIVAVGVTEFDTATPNSNEAVIRLNDDALQTLTGETESATGVRTTYVDQLFFYVPANNSDEKVRLLGYASSILGAEILPEPTEDSQTDTTTDPTTDGANTGTNG